jgi:hypothetical protein
MGHGDCFDNEYGKVPESRQRVGEGERDYFEHVRGYKVSSADNMLVIAAVAFLISLGFGIHLSREPVPTSERPAISAAFVGEVPTAAKWCDDRHPYGDNAC